MMRGVSLMNSMNPKVDEFISKAKKWQEEYKACS